MSLSNKWLVGFATLLSFTGTGTGSSAAPRPSHTIAESSHAREIVLFTSFSPEQTPLPERIQGRHRLALQQIVQEAPANLEEAFRHHYDSERVDLRVVHHATQGDFWDAAHSTRTLGIIWVSHAGGASNTSGGLRVASPIIDFNGFDIANAIQDFHPGLRFLGVVACSSGAALEEQWMRFNIHRRFPNLEVRGFASATDATQGLRDVMSWSEGAIQTTRPTIPPPTTFVNSRSSLRLRITRTFFPPVVRSPSDASARLPLQPGTSHPILLPAVRVETSAGKVLGIFPRSFGGAPQILEVDLPGHSRGLTQSDQLNLIMNAGDNPSMSPERMELGRFEIRAPQGRQLEGLHWTPYADPNGRPIGLTQNLYEFTGVLPPLEALRR